MQKIEEKYLVSKHTSPPIKDLKVWKQQWESLYKEAGGDGVRPVKHPDYPEYLIYSTGGWSYLGKEHK